MSNVTKMDQYEQLKEKLLQQVDDVHRQGEQLKQKYPQYGDIGTQMMKTSERLYRLCNDGLFAIALGAQFQSGKSTTCNVFAEGRDVCPTGNGGGGIRTSSCSVQLANKVKGEPELALIEWLSPEELDIALKDALDHTASDKPLSLTQPEDIKVAWKEVADIMADYIKNPGEKSQKQLDGMKQALLILTYYQDRKLEELRTQKTFTLSEARRYLSFPSDLSLRWERVRHAFSAGEAPWKSVSREFSLEDALYAFIRRASFYTDSEYLGQLGAVVVDTPGLNMSENDTKVALAAMQSASAIFWFFNGEKELSSEDRESLQMIRKAKLASKVFFGINFKGHQKKQVEQNILTELQALGYNEPHQQTLLHYNAFLAQRAKQGILLQAGKLDRLSMDAILQYTRNNGITVRLNDCEVDLDECTTSADGRFLQTLSENIPIDQVVKAAWVASTEDVMRRVKAEGYRDFEDLGLCEESVQLALNASRWNETIRDINDYIIKNRGRAMLIGQVLDPILDDLGVIEARLKQDEANAEATAEEMQKAYNDALAIYQTFCEESNGIIDQYISSDWDQAIADDIYEKVLLTSVGNAATKAAKELSQNQNMIKSLGDLGTRLRNRVGGLFGVDHVKSKLEAQSEQIIQNALREEIQLLHTAWTEEFESSRLYRTLVKGNVENVTLRMENLWNSMNLDANDLLRAAKQCMNANLPKGTFSQDAQLIQLSSERLNSILDTPNDLGGSLLNAMKGIGAGYGTMVGLVAIYLYVLPADFVVPGAAEIIAIVGIIVGALVNHFASQKTKDKKLAQQAAKLESEIKNQLLQDKPKLTRQLIGDQDSKSGVRVFRLFYEAAFKNALDKAMNSLKEDSERALEQARKSDEERKKIGQTAREIREKMINPITSAGAELHREIEEICG